MAAPERLAEVSQTRAGWFWPLIYTFALHAILFALLFVSFALAPQIPAAQPVIQATVYQLKAERPKSAPVADKITAEAQKTKAAEREAEQFEQQKRQREAEQQRKAEQAAALAKAAESKRQAEAAKAAEALKQAEEKARQVAEQAQKQAAEAKRLEAERKQREAEAVKKRAAEQARQKAEAEAAAKATEAKRKAEEAARQKREAEARRQQEVEAKRQREAEEAKRRAEEDRKAKARAELLAAEVQRRRAQGESERLQLIASLDELFVRLVSEQWIRPASTRDGISSEIQVSMLPDGTITQAVLVRSSGDTPFDNSTLAALRSIGRIPEMQQLDRASFDALYRKRNLIFRPEDLER